MKGSRVGVGVGREHQLLRPQDPLRGAQEEAARPALDGPNGGVLIDVDAEALGGPLQPPHISEGVEEGAAGLPPGPQVAGRVHLFPHGLGVQPLDPGQPQAMGQLDLLPDPSDVSRGGGHAQEPRPLVIACDAVAGDELPHIVDGLLHIAMGFRGGLAAEAKRRQGEGEPEEGHGEAGVAPAGPIADVSLLQNGDLEARLRLFQMQGGGEAGEPPADDRHVRAHLPRQGRVRRVGIRSPQPEALQLHSGEPPEAHGRTATANTSRSKNQRKGIQWKAM
jgi:hypothetical protein